MDSNQFKLFLRESLLIKFDNILHRTTKLFPLDLFDKMTGSFPI